MTSAPTNEEHGTPCCVTGGKCTVDRCATCPFRGKRFPSFDSWLSAYKYQAEQFDHGDMKACWYAAQRVCRAAARLSESGGQANRTGEPSSNSAVTGADTGPAPPTPSALVERQANDPALWFVAQTAPEAYLQKALRELHRAIEESPADLSDEAQEVVARLRADESQLADIPFEGLRVALKLMVALCNEAAALIERLEREKAEERRLHDALATGDRETIERQSREIEGLSLDAERWNALMQADPTEIMDAALMSHDAHSLRAALEPIADAALKERT